MKRCPKCGHDKFTATAHVAETWLLDENEAWEQTLEQATDIIHRPNDKDLWTCVKCGYKAPGDEFNVPR